MRPRYSRGGALHSYHRRRNQSGTTSFEHIPVMNISSPPCLLRTLILDNRWQPVVDGTFVADFPTKLTAEGKFVKVPMMIGE
jgi:hypothetical protein